MQLLAPNDVPVAIVGRVCRQSRIVITLGTILMFGFLAALPAFVVWKTQSPWWISGPVYGFTMMMTLFLGRRAIRPFTADNWLLRIAPDGLWINTRSYLNPDFAPARTIVFVPNQEIASAGEHVVRRAERGSDGTTAWSDKYLDILLKLPASPEVREQISQERTRTVKRSHLFGLVTSNSRDGHVPVSMPSDDVIRLAWRGRFDFIVPSIATTLRDLAANCRVDEASVKDASRVDRMTDEEVDRLVIECVETGDRFGAIKLLQDRRGYTLTEAKKFIDELTVRV